MGKYRVDSYSFGNGGVSPQQSFECRPSLGYYRRNPLATYGSYNSYNSGSDFDDLKRDASAITGAAVGLAKAQARRNISSNEIYATGETAYYGAVEPAAKAFKGAALIVAATAVDALYLFKVDKAEQMLKEQRPEAFEYLARDLSSQNAVVVQPDRDTEAVTLRTYNDSLSSNAVIERALSIEATLESESVKAAEENKITEAEEQCKNANSAIEKELQHAESSYKSFVSEENAKLDAYASEREKYLNGVQDTYNAACDNAERTYESKREDIKNTYGLDSVEGSVALQRAEAELKSSISAAEAARSSLEQAVWADYNRNASSIQSELDKRESSYNTYVAEQRAKVDANIGTRDSVISMANQSIADAHARAQRVIGEANRTYGADGTSNTSLRNAIDKSNAPQQRDMTRFTVDNVKVSSASGRDSYVAAAKANQVQIARDIAFLTGTNEERRLIEKAGQYSSNFLNKSPLTAAEKAQLQDIEKRYGATSVAALEKNLAAVKSIQSKLSDNIERQRNELKSLTSKKAEMSSRLSASAQAKELLAAGKKADGTALTKNEIDALKEKVLSEKDSSKILADLKTKDKAINETGKRLTALSEKNKHISALVTSGDRQIALMKKHGNVIRNHKPKNVVKQERRAKARALFTTSAAAGMMSKRAGKMMKKGQANFTQSIKGFTRQLTRKTLTNRDGPKNNRYRYLFRHK